MPAKLTLNRDCKTTIQWLSRGGFSVWRHYAKLDEESVILEWDKAEAVLAMAKGIPGWNSGQTDAPHPIQVEDVD